MTTFADNINEMAAMVAKIKKTFHLNEGTIMRIIDMNFALAQNPPYTPPLPEEVEQQLNELSENDLPNIPEVTE